MLASGAQGMLAAGAQGILAAGAQGMLVAGALGKLAAGVPGMATTGRSMVQNSLSNTDNPFKRKDRTLFFLQRPCICFLRGQYQA